MGGLMGPALSPDSVCVCGGGPLWQNAHELPEMPPEWPPQLNFLLLSSPGLTRPFLSPLSTRSLPLRVYFEIFTPGMMGLGCGTRGSAEVTGVIH